MTVTRVVQFSTELGSTFDNEADAIRVDKEERFGKAYLDNPIRYCNTAEIGELTNAPTQEVVTWLVQNKQMVRVLFEEGKEVQPAKQGYYHVLEVVEIFQNMPEYKDLYNKPVETVKPTRQIRRTLEGETPSFWGVFENETKQLVEEFGELSLATSYCQELNRKKEDNRLVRWSIL